MKRVLLTLAIAFTVFTFVGGIYVLVNNGLANAGYAVIPMMIACAFLAGYRVCKNKEDNDKPTE